jgi:hydroxymethylpyrimidine/phosphomethylpyrimidine kinase
MLQTPPLVLTIAGYDPSSGAGVTADIKTIAAHGCYGVAVITALTVQSTSGVKSVYPVDERVLVESLEELTADVKVSAVHVGMLGNGPVALAVAAFLDQAQLPNLVVDPVLKASSGATLLDDAGLEVLRARILPLAAVITPNLEEAELLTGMRIENSEDMKAAAGALHAMGAQAAIITGGHLEHAIDVLSVKNDYVQVFRAERVVSPNTHGTGCAFATSVTCQLALGRSLSAAVLLTKAYITDTIRNSYSIGKGTGPINHMYQMKNHPRNLGMTKKLASGNG